MLAIFVSLAPPLLRFRELSESRFSLWAEPWLRFRIPPCIKTRRIYVCRGLSKNESCRKRASVPPLKDKVAIFNISRTAGKTEGESLPVSISTCVLFHEIRFRTQRKFQVVNQHLQLRKLPVFFTKRRRHFRAPPSISCRTSAVLHMTLVLLRKP